MASRYRNSSTATATPGGTAVFTIQPPPPGVVITGSLGIPGAPTNALASVNIGGITWGAWAGNATFGPVQQWNAEPIIVTVTGLVGSSSNTLVLIGLAEDEDKTQIIWPSAIATSLSSTSVSVPAFHGARVAKTANQVITSGAGNVLTTYDVAVQDSDAYFDNANDRLVVPTGLDGTYLVIVYMQLRLLTIAVPSVVQGFVQLNGSPLGYINMEKWDTELKANSDISLIFSGYLALVATDNISVSFNQSTGANVSVLGAASDFGFRSELQMALLGI